MDAAEHPLHKQGAARTSLRDNARRAGAMRGAMYGRFTDKADLFNAMKERITLPMEAVFRTETGHAPQADGSVPALAQIRQAGCQS